MEKLREAEGTRMKTGAQAHGREKARSPGDKLKNESSARKAMSRKLRHGKADNTLTAEEKKFIKKKQIQGRRAIDREMAVKESFHRMIDRANEDQNVAVQAVNESMEAADGAAGLLQRSAYSRKLEHRPEEETFRAGSKLEKGLAGPGASSDGGPSLERDNSAYSGHGGKLGRNAREANRKTGEAADGVSKGSKAAQKKLMQKEFQSAAAKASEKQAANQVGSRSKKFIDKAEDLAGRFGEWLIETIADHPGILLIIAVILIVVLVVSSFTSSTGVLMNTLGHSTVESSFTADDDQILTVEEDYKEKESDLQDQLDNIESDYPGYDEYRYSLAEINHNPYELAALLTVLYEDYTEAEVQEKLSEIFDKQYELTTEDVTETRTRTETRTGTRTVTNPDGSTSEEDYEYEVEVEYDYHILNVTLTNATMAAVVRDMGLTEDQMARYELLIETLGNKSELFAGNPYAVPDPGDYADYDIPPEALTDTKFSNMIREAEKYLGYPYVWGGSSPSTSFDCSGFVSWVINHSGNGWNVGRQTANGLLSNCARVSRDEAKPGDLIFFQGTYDTPGASHVGIYVGNGMMIHCGNPIQYASINTNYWRQHFYTFGRIR